MGIFRRAPKPARTRYYGFTRYSVHIPGGTAWRVSRESADQTITLFSDERMQLRNDIFLDRAMPIYQSWADRYEYRHVVHFSSDLPEKWRSRLEEAAKRYPCLILDEVVGKIAAHPLIGDDIARSGEPTDLVVRLRVDDDDLLAADYLDALDKYVQPAHVGYAVSFGLGVGALYSGGRYVEFREQREILPSAGQAYIEKYDPSSGSIRGIRAAAHNRIDTAVPVIFDSREPMYVQTYHDQQDREFGKADDPRARLSKFKAIDDPDLIARKFPTLKQDLLAAIQKSDSHPEPD